MEVLASNRVVNLVCGINELLVEQILIDILSTHKLVGLSKNRAGSSNIRSRLAGSRGCHELIRPTTYEQVIWSSAAEILSRSNQNAFVSL